MNWKILKEIDQLKEIEQKSHNKLQLIFKHSTRCIISKMALKNFENEFDLPDLVDAYYLDLIAFRSVSNAIADIFKIEHQSPQLLIIKDGKVVFHESHEGIDAREIANYV